MPISLYIKSARARCVVLTLIGCNVNSTAIFGVRHIVKKSPNLRVLRNSGKYRPACLWHHTGVRSVFSWRAVRKMRSFLSVGNGVARVRVDGSNTGNVFGPVPFANGPFDHSKVGRVTSVVIVDDDMVAGEAICAGVMV